MSGAVTLEQSNKPSPKNPPGNTPASPFVTMTPEMQNVTNEKNDNNQILSPLMKSDAIKTYNKELMNRTVFVEGHKRRFLPNQTQHNDGTLLSNMGNVRVNFRDTGNVPKIHNHMLRTTFGLKDEASSDTVSTEHNYLQPTVRRMDINHRASIQTSQNGSNIHVQEHNISTPDPVDAPHGSTIVRKEYNVSPLIIQKELGAARQLSMFDQESQVMLDTPTMSPLKREESSGNKHLPIMKSQLSKAKLAPLTISPQGWHRQDGDD